MDSEITEKFEALNRSIDKIDAYCSILDGRIDSYSQNLELNNYNSALCQKASEVFKSWLEQLLDKNVNSIADLVTSGLNHIIEDHDLSFLIKQEPKYNKIAMKFVICQDGHEGNPTDSYGGGAVLISSLILRLAIMARLNMSNLLILDESLNALSKKYIPNCGEFMRDLSEETGINILMVTHNEEFLSSCHTAYEAYSVSDGTNADGNQKHKLRLTPYDVHSVMSS